LLVKNKARLRRRAFAVLVLFLIAYSNHLFGSVDDEPIDNEPADIVVWVGETEFGFVIADGTSKVRSVSGLLDLTKDGDVWRNQVLIETLNVSNNRIPSVEKYLGSYKTDYKFETDEFLFIELNYENDRFSGFSYEATFVSGLDKVVLNHGNHIVSIELGPGYRYLANLDDTSEEEAILRIATKYRYALSETAEFQFDIEADAGEDAIISKSTMAIKSQINGHVSMKVSLTAKHNSDIPDLLVEGEEVQKTNFETAFRIVYSFL